MITQCCTYMCNNLCSHVKIAQLIVQFTVRELYAHSPRHSTLRCIAVAPTAAPPVSLDRQVISKNYYPRSTGIAFQQYALLITQYRHTHTPLPAPPRFRRHILPLLALRCHLSLTLFASRAFEFCSLLFALVYAMLFCILLNYHEFSIPYLSELLVLVLISLCSRHREPHIPSCRSSLPMLHFHMKPLMSSSSPCLRSC